MPKSASKLTIQLSFEENGQNLGKTSARISGLRLWFEKGQRRYGYAHPLSTPHITQEHWRTHNAAGHVMYLPHRGKKFQNLFHTNSYPVKKGYNHELRHRVISLYMANFEDAVCKTEHAGSRPDSTWGTDDRKSLMSTTITT